MVVGVTVAGAIGFAAAVAGYDTGGTAAASVEVAPSPARTAITPVAATPGIRTGAVAPEAPGSVRLPSGRTVPVRSVGTIADGTLDVPGDIDAAGWWRGGSRIGDPFGSVLVAAHVDSATQGLGPFAELLSVDAGQHVVLTSEHLRQEYVISELRLVDKGRLADHDWVYAPSGPHRLTLVTCAGPFVPGKGGYQRLAVVTATAVGQPVLQES